MITILFTFITAFVHRKKSVYTVSAVSTSLKVHILLRGPFDRLIEIILFDFAWLRATAVERKFTLTLWKFYNTVHYRGHKDFANSMN